MIEQGSGTLWEMTRYAQVITLIGAGGKTTTLQSLAEQINAQGKNVIGTTTTKVYPMTWKAVWKNPLLSPPIGSEYPCFWYAREEAENQKWIGPTVDILDQALRLRVEHPETLEDNLWLIEGDGAREKKLKCWDSHEPQIPLGSRCAILVISGGLWGRILTGEEIHRSEKSPGLVGRAWSGEAAAKYILSSPAFYAEYEALDWIVFFNEYDIGNPEYSESALYIESVIDCLKKDFKNHLENHSSQARKQVIKPLHLRIASGNARKGRIRWYDLW